MSADKIQRFERSEGGCYERDDGEHCLYSDYEALAERLAAAQEEVERLKGENDALSTSFNAANKDACDYHHQLDQLRATQRETLEGLARECEDRATQLCGNGSIPTTRKRIDEHNAAAIYDECARIIRSRLTPETSRGEGWPGYGSHPHPEAELVDATAAPAAPAASGEPEADPTDEMRLAAWTAYWGTRTKLTNAEQRIRHAFLFAYREGHDRSARRGEAKVEQAGEDGLPSDEWFNDKIDPTNVMSSGDLRKARYWMRAGFRAARGGK